MQDSGFFIEKVILEFSTGFLLKRQGKLKIGNYQNLGLRTTDGNEFMSTGRWESCRARSDSVGANKFSKWVSVFLMCCFLPRHKFSVVLNRSCLVTATTGAPNHIFTFSVRSSFILWASQDRSLGLVFVSSLVATAFNLPLYSLVASSNMPRAPFCA